MWQQSARRPFTYETKKEHKIWGKIIEILGANSLESSSINGDRVDPG